MAKRNNGLVTFRNFEISPPVLVLQRKFLRKYALHAYEYNDIIIFLAYFLQKYEILNHQVGTELSVCLAYTIRWTV